MGKRGFGRIGTDVVVAIPVIRRRGLVVMSGSGVGVDDLMGEGLIVEGSV